MPILIHSEADLAAWAARVMGPCCSPADARHAAAYFRNLPNRPAWGTDWGGFLNSYANPELLFAAVPTSGF